MRFIKYGIIAVLLLLLYKEIVQYSRFITKMNYYSYVGPPIK